MHKSLNQRKQYISHKSKQLDKITDAFKYTRRLERIMQYNNLLMALQNAEIKQILKGEELK